MALDKRVIAIQVSPKAYDEILRLKGEQTWTMFELKCVLAKNGDNAILKDELAGLIAEAKAKAKAKVEKPKAEKKVKKAKVTKEEPTEAELKAIEDEQTTEPKPEPTFGVPGKKTAKK